MKRIAILSQGPTASQYEPESGYDAVIGVNAMPAVWPCDWWCFSDWQSYGKWADQILGSPRLCVRSTVASKIKVKDPSNAERFTEHDGTLIQDDLGLPPFPTGNTVWNRYSGPGALALAWHLKPERVDCYGCDMSGGEDYFGISKDSRAESRWKQERYVWSRMVQAMRKDGVEVYHATDSGTLAPAPEPDTAPHPRLWQYRNAHGWVTQRFRCRDEQAFRSMLSGLIGERAKGAEIREVEL